jgi:hypothetical protein
VRSLRIALLAVALLGPLALVPRAAAVDEACDTPHPGVVQVHQYATGPHYQPSTVDGDGTSRTLTMLGHDGSQHLVAAWAAADCDAAWGVTPEGHVYIGGSAGHFGQALGRALNAPIVGMAVTPSGEGYWLVASDGGIFAYGDATFLGSTGAMVLNRPIVAMAATPTGDGYWLVASDGGVFTFGDAAFLGSMGARPLNAPIVGMTSTPSGEGYWMVGSDGGIFTFGDADFLGSTGAATLAAPIVGMVPFGDGYAVVDREGTISSFTGSGSSMTEGGHDHGDESDTTDDETLGTGPIISVDDPRVTEAQRAAAVALIERTEAAMAAFPDEEAVQDAGYASIGDGASGFEHYLKLGYLSDGAELDEDKIESIVLRVWPDGSKTVESAMYILSINDTMADVPDIAGELTTWHKHDDLCFSIQGSELRVVGLAVDGACASGNLFVTPPMLHVWITPQACGPFAGIETGNHGSSCHPH